MADDWTATVAAERMKLDREFADALADSSFDRQQWGLVMTAIEFEIENPSDPEAAEIVADATNLPAVLPELDRIAQQNPGGGTPDGGSGGGGSGGGIIDSVKGALGLDTGRDERREEATRLANRYGDRLQEMLEANGRWEEVCRRASA